jgi:hypothetical protein
MCEDCTGGVQEEMQTRFFCFARATRTPVKIRKILEVSYKSASCTNRIVAFENYHGAHVYSVNISWCNVFCDEGLSMRYN